MSLPVRVGVVGLGQRGLQHLTALWRMQEEGLTRIVALVDAFEENLSEAKLRSYVPQFVADGVHMTMDVRSVLDCDALDALYVAIPPGRHDGEVLLAAERGVHLFVEKPMSLYMNEALEMDRAIRESGVIATVGFQHRYDARNEAAHRFLTDKRVVMLTCVHHGSLEGHSVKHTATERLGGPPNRIWTANREWSGSTVVEAGIHQTDLMRYWCGDIAWVEASYVHRDPEDIENGADNPYAYRVTYGFENGAIGNLLMSRLRRVYHHDGYQSVIWTHGHLRFEGNEVVAYFYDGPYPPATRPRPNELRHVLPLPRSRNATDAINRAFVDAVASSDPTPLRSTFSSSLNSLAAALAANASDRRDGERISLSDFCTERRYAAHREKPGSA